MFETVVGSKTNPLNGSFSWGRLLSKSCIPQRLNRAGFSLVELMVGVAILAILGTVGSQSYLSYTQKVEDQKAIDDIKAMEVLINLYEQENGSQPGSLDEVPGIRNMEDPWGNPYEYLPFNGGGNNHARKDRNLHPINTDYDLYSKGRDGKSTLPLTAKISQDDIIRANNGAFIGLAADY
jgi:general secretion pathway protein G